MARHLRPCATIELASWEKQRQFPQPEKSATLNLNSMDIWVIVSHVEESTDLVTLGFVTTNFPITDEHPDGPLNIGQPLMCQRVIANSIANHLNKAFAKSKEMSFYTMPATTDLVNCTFDPDELDNVLTARQQAEAGQIGCVILAIAPMLIFLLSTCS